jgi:intracellular septation protein A
MGGENLMVGILPIVVFVLVDIYVGARAGALAAIGLAVLWLGWSYWRLGEIDTLSWVEFGCIVVLGSLSAWLNKSQFFKFQPVVVGLLAAAFLGYFQLTDRPLLIQMIPTVKKMISEAQANLFDHPQMIVVLSRTSGHLAVLFAVHAVFVGYAALRRSTVYWMWARLAIYPLMFVLLTGEMIAGFR